MKPYEKFAAAYDAIGHDRFSVRMAEYTLKVLQKFKAAPIDGLDLCCGTGSAIETLSDHGIMMSGLDGSKPMISVAHKKLAGRKVKLYHQRLPKFDISTKDNRGRKTTHRFDLVTSFFDSLNYLTSERDLKATFLAVYRHLKPGGWFVFDMNTVHMLRTVFTGQQPYAGVNDKVAWIIRNDPRNDGEFGNILITFFLKEGRTWKRYDEIHRERAYSNATIKNLLTASGFQVKGLYSCFSFDKPTPTTKRIAVAARRPA
jgi:SAM-dependent methyltransferase